MTTWRCLLVLKTVLDMTQYRFKVLDFKKCCFRNLAFFPTLPEILQASILPATQPTQQTKNEILQTSRPKLKSYEPAVHPWPSRPYFVKFSKLKSYRPGDYLWPSRPKLKSYKPADYLWPSRPYFLKLSKLKSYKPAEYLRPSRLKLKFYKAGDYLQPRRPYFGNLLTLKSYRPTDQN